MTENPDPRAELRDLFASTRLAVLSTHSEGQPYASLVAFTATDDLVHLVFATSRLTRKYANLKADARVALLIDNRSNTAEDFREARAATATGRAQEASEEEKASLLHGYVARHDTLEEFARDPDTAIFKVDVDTYYLVSRFQNVTTLRMT